MKKLKVIEVAESIPDMVEVLKDEEEEGLLFSGLYATLPKYKAHITAEERELYRIVYVHSNFDCKGYEIARAFTALQVYSAKKARQSNIEIAWIASLTYTAGKINGIRQERARIKRGKLN